MANLREVDFFEEGCIGAEDVVLDAKIQRKGHKLFIDPSNVMPHRRRVPFKPFMKQMRNYGYTRMVANKRWPEISRWSHTAIGFFPPLVVLSIIAVIYGMLSGGAADEYWLTLSENGLFHVLPSMVLGTDVNICWHMLARAAIGTSPHRSIGTRFSRPIIRISSTMGLWPSGDQGVERNQ